MEAYVSIHKEKHQNVAKIWSGVTGLIIIVLILIPLFFPPTPPPGQLGVLVSLGNVDTEAGSDIAVPVAEQKEVKPEAKEKEETKPEVNTPETKSDTKEVIEDKASKERALKKRLEKERQEREAAAAAAEQKRLEEEREALKGQITDIFETSTKETEGSDSSDDAGPSTDNLDGDNSEPGIVGGGLGNRNGSGPKLIDTSSKSGTVVVKVCVNEQGKVTTAKFKLKGSTTQDALLRQLAIENASKWTFKAGESECGWITYKFKTQ